jgi:CRISPR-associated protein Cmr4
LDWRLWGYGNKGGFIMYKQSGMLFFYTETPLHAGSGASVSHIDLPIQREKHTGHPIVQGSGVKGAFRDWANRFSTQPDHIEYVFGPDPKENTSSEFGGSLSFTDAQLLFFPVRSFSGGFAWVTCPIVLNRLSRRLEMANFGSLPSVEVADDSILTANSSDLIAHNNQVVLEDFSFKQMGQDQNERISTISDWVIHNALPTIGAFKYISDHFSKRMAIVSDTVFKDFVSLSTEVVTRIRIGENGVVEKGALWTQELLPTDCLMYSLAIAKDITDTHQKDRKQFSSNESISFLRELVYNSDTGILQMGGDETVGRGIVRVRFIEKP